MEALKAEDLRYGNYLYYNVSDTPIPDLLPNKVDWQDLKECEEQNELFNRFHSPIQLTPDLLMKCGLVDLRNGEYQHPELFNTIFFNLNEEQFFTRLNSEDSRLFFTGRIKFLHQFQNAFKVIHPSGQELTVKL